MLLPRYNRVIMKQQIYQSVVYQEGKYYVAQCLNVDVSSFGDNEQEALTNLQEALELYLEGSSAPATPTIIEHPTVHTFRLQHA
jgi:predicted RNase H-like HicB family nuclease